jgi:hypothetical protein
MSDHPKSVKPCADCGKPFEGTAPARYCPECRWKHRGRYPVKYIWTPERDQVLLDRYDSRVKGRAAEIAAALGWPAWVVRKQASRLGLAHPWPADRRDWTPKEERFLLHHAGSRHVHWMAKQLGRSETSVILKLKRMKISRRWREGYTLRELELCFGCDHHGIERWIRQGWLTGRRRGTRRQGPGGRGNGPADPWVFSDAAILEFIQQHPMEFRLDKVDQFWFLDLVFDGGLVTRALATERRLEAS